MNMFNEIAFCYMLFIRYFELFDKQMWLSFHELKKIIVILGKKEKKVSINNNNKENCRRKINKKNKPKANSNDVEFSEWKSLFCVW